MSASVLLGGAILVIAIVALIWIRMQSLLNERGRQRDQAEAALRESEQRLSYVIRATRSAQWDWDVLSQQIKHDQRWLDLLGLDDGALAHPTQVYFDRVEPKDLPLLKKAIAIAERQNGEYSLEYRLRRTDGRLIWVLDQGLIVTRGPQGQATRMVGAISDITERKNQDKELEQHRHHLASLVTQRTSELEVAKQEAEAANRAKSDFLANMSHEIRTPMNAVLGIAYLLGKSNLPPQTQYLVRKIVSAGRSLQMIINDILDYSKIESGHLDIELVPFDLAHVLYRLSMMLSTSAEEKGLALIIAPPPRGAEHLVGDALKLEQLLVNLTGNAIKFTQQGQVLVKTSVLTRSDHGVTLKFSILDTGIGIPAEKQSQLFQPFTQADVSTTRRFGGTGLGLAISRRLVETLGGDIGLSSRPGAGSEFWFSLSFRIDREKLSAITTPEPVGMSPLPLVSHRLQGLRMLVVDDSAINREISQRLFESEGARVFLANEGQQAVNWLQQHADGVDIVLMDVQMPVMDGYEATRVIRAMPQFQNLPILALSAGVFKSMQDAALAAGMNDFIGKPYDVDAAIARVRSLTGLDRRGRAPDVTPLAWAEPRAQWDGAEDLPGLKVDEGLQKWKDKNVYVRALRKFATDHADSAQIMMQGNAQSNVLLAHKIVGMAGNLALPGLVETAKTVNQVCQAGDDTAAAIQAYAQALELTLASIARYVANDVPGRGGVTVSTSADPLSVLLAEVLLAFNSDDPSKVEPLLMRLGNRLSEQQLAPLWAAVAEFNFQLGKDATLALANELKMPMEISQ